MCRRRKWRIYPYHAFIPVQAWILADGLSKMAHWWFFWIIPRRGEIPAIVALQVSMKSPRRKIVLWQCSYAHTHATSIRVTTKPQWCGRYLPFGRQRSATVHLPAHRLWLNKVGPTRGVSFVRTIILFFGDISTKYQHLFVDLKLWIYLN